MTWDPLTIIAFTLDALAVIVGAFIFTKSSPALRLYIAFLAIGLVFTLVCIYLAEHNTNNMLLFHLFTLVEFICMLIVLILWSTDAKVKRVFKGILLLYFTFWIIMKFTIENLSTYDTYTSSLSTAILIIGIGYVLSRLIVESNLSILRPSILILIGAFIYYSGNLILFSLSTIPMYWQIHNFLESAYKIPVIIGFVLAWKQ